MYFTASNDGHYEKGKNQNNLREEDIQRIVDAYDKYENIDRFAHVASPDEIKENIANIKRELAEVEVKMQKQLEELGL